jgi:hypothetical protein
MKNFSFKLNFKKFLNHGLTTLVALLSAPELTNIFLSLSSSEKMVQKLNVSEDILKNASTIFVSAILGSLINFLKQKNKKLWPTSS